MDPKDIRSAFRVRLCIQLVCLVPVVGLLFTVLNDPHSVSPLVVLGAALLPVVVAFFNWRCPACKVFLGRNLLQFRCRGCNAGLLE